jgi:hypothetical protein
MLPSLSLRVAFGGLRSRLGAMLSGRSGQRPEDRGIAALGGFGGGIFPAVWRGLLMGGCSMAKRYEPKDGGQIQKELDGESDRAAILVGAAMVDHALERCIRSRLRPPTTKTEERMLFAESGIFGTYSKKILATYFLRLIGEVTKRDLMLIGEMRNQTAHDMNPVSFDNTSEISIRCRELNLPKENIPGITKPEGPRACFLFTVITLYGALLIRAQDNTDFAKPALHMAAWLDR